MKELLPLRIQLFAEGLPGDPGPKGPSGKSADPLEAQYLEQIDELKRQMDSMVAGDEYNRVLAEHKKLTDDFINRRPAPKKKETKLDDATTYAKKLKENKFRNNREFIETSLDYRDAFIKETGKDPWSDAGDVTEDTKLVADHLKSLLTDIDSASEFNFRLRESLVDDPTLTKTLRTKK